MSIAERLRAQIQGLSALADEVEALEASAVQTPAPAPVEPPAPEPPAPQPPAPPPVEPPAPEPVQPGVAYRAQTPLLFQAIAAATIPARLPGQVSYDLDIVGPTQTAVDATLSWLWANKGGDWIDADGMPQGARAWSTTTVDAVAVGESAAYSIDATGALLHAMRQDMPFAVILRCTAPRDVDTRFGAQPPRCVVEYADGSSADLALNYAGPANVGKPAQGARVMSFPAFLEFVRPATEPVKATISFRALTKARNSSPLCSLFLLSPDRSLPPVTTGTGDAGLIGAHDYADDKPIGDFLHFDNLPGWARNINAENNYSPELFTEGATPDLTKYPHRGLGKWHNHQDNAQVSVVRSADIPHGPVRPGLGALTATLVRDPRSVEGGFVTYSGSVVCRLEMPMPEPLLGRLDHLFVRYYFSWAPLPGEPDAIDLREILGVYKGPAQTTPAWTSSGGKFGIAPTHDTKAGGFSGSAGGGRGWEMRHGWGFAVTGKPGPDADALMGAFHLYDFQNGNPPGYVNAGTKYPSPYGWGKMGALYARRWYCIETELKLNSVDQPGTLKDGTPHYLNGVRQFWTPDGELRVWVDGRIAFEDTGLVFRSLPTVPRPASWKPADGMMPIRELGVRSLILNFFCGGTTTSSKGMTQYYADLKYGTKRIGR